MKGMDYTGWSGMFFIMLPPLFRKHWAAIGCTEICQPIGVNARSHCVESFENFQRYIIEGWVAVDNEKTQFFVNTL